MVLPITQALTSCSMRSRTTPNLASLSSSDPSPGRAAASPTVESTRRHTRGLRDCSLYGGCVIKNSMTTKRGAPKAVLTSRRAKHEKPEMRSEARKTGGLDAVQRLLSTGPDTQGLGFHVRARLAEQPSQEGAAKKDSESARKGRKPRVIPLSRQLQPVDALPRNVLPG